MTVRNGMSFWKDFYNENKILIIIAGVLLVVLVVIIGFQERKLEAEDVYFEETVEEVEEIVSKYASDEMKGDVVVEEEEEDKEEDEEDVVSDAYRVVYIVDGDTFEMNTGERVRLVCIDTPERDEYYYDEASDYLEFLVLDGEVELVKDVSEVDEYGRLLRYVYVGDVFVNEKMVRGGYARVFAYGVDTALCSQIEEAEAEAKSEGLGIWREREVISLQSASGGYVCSSNFYNCGDFDSYEEALEVFEFCGGIDEDVHRLDRDKDGLPCEGLM